jgi:DNA mismatch repair protein MutL
MFNKYIFVEFEKELWVIDQHAAAERINYEKLKKQYDSKAIEVQKLLMPDEITMSETEALSIQENIEALESFGFKLNVSDNKVIITEVPAILSGQNLEVVFKELVDEILIRK